MKTIICENKDILVNLKEFLNDKGSIADIFVIEQEENNVVFLLNDKSKITPELAQIWWEGYQAGMGAI